MRYICRIFKYPLAFIFFWLFISTEGLCSDKPEAYVAYPIVFVHGLNSSSDAWDDTRNDFFNYFYNKYGYLSHLEFFPVIDYRDMNCGDITVIKNRLESSINNAIKKLKKRKDVTISDKKVIIVAHSMGGLVTRNLLKKTPEIKDKIHKIVYIGTPHQGAPVADVIWFDVELAGMILPSLIEKYTLFDLYDSSFAYRGMIGRLENEQSYIDDQLRFVISFFGMNPFGTAFEQLRLGGTGAGDVQYNKSFSAGIWPWKITESISETISDSETFIAPAQGNLGQDGPDKQRIIYGVEGLWWVLKMWGLEKLAIYGEENFIFPLNYSLADARAGDGIVPTPSQCDASSSAEPKGITAHHLDETLASDAILKAIDDEPPILQGIFSRPKEMGKPKNSTYRLVTTIKEYLLADVEVDMQGDTTYNGKPNLSDHNKDFWKDRVEADVKGTYGNPLKLKARQSYMDVSLSSSKYIQQLKTRLTNPAEVSSHPEGEGYINYFITPSKLMAKINDKEKDADFEYKPKPKDYCGGRSECKWLPPKLTEWKRHYKPFWANHNQLTTTNHPASDYLILGTDDPNASPQLSNEALPYSWNEVTYQINQLRGSINRLMGYYSPKEWGKPWSDNSTEEEGEEGNTDKFFKAVNGTTDWLSLPYPEPENPKDMEVYFENIEEALAKLGENLAGKKLTAKVNDNDPSRGDRFRVSIDDKSTTKEENQYTTLNVWVGPGNHTVKVTVIKAPDDKIGSFRFSVTGHCSGSVPGGFHFVPLGSSETYTVCTGRR